MNSKKYNSIDLCKLIMALCVVAIHTQPFYNCEFSIVNNIYDSIVSMAVPFFFISSGFLLAKKLDMPFCTAENVKIIGVYLRKITRLYVLWTIIYFPMAIWHFISTDSNWIKAVLIYLRGFVFIGEQYNSWHLWYLLATVYALLFVLLLLKRRQAIDKIVVVGFVIFLMSIGITFFVDNGKENYPAILAAIRKILVHTVAKGRIFTGMFFIPVGMLLSNKKIPVNISWIMLIIGFLINCFTTDSVVSSILVAVSAIGLFEVIESICIVDSIIFLYFRKISIIVYFIHMYVWSIYYKLVYGKKTFGMDSFFVTSITSCFIAIVYIFIKNKKTKYVKCKMPK